MLKTNDLFSSLAEEIIKYRDHMQKELDAEIERNPEAVLDMIAKPLAHRFKMNK